jgi:hypothetical protein
MEAAGRGGTVGQGSRCQEVQLTCVRESPHPCAAAPRSLVGLREDAGRVTKHRPRPQPRPDDGEALVDWRTTSVRPSFEDGTQSQFNPCAYG